MDGKMQARHKRFQPRLRAHEWTIPALAEKIGMPRITLYFWIRKGHVAARRVPGLGTIEYDIETAAEKVLRAKLERNFAHRLYIGV
jgi:hypothetical protein